jgi:transposase
MKKLYHVRLSDEERAYLQGLTSKGKSSARKLNRARVLLLVDAGKRDQEIRDAVGVKASFVERTRQRFAEGGMERALNDQPRPGRKPKLDGKQEAFLVALNCSDAPDGQETWTLRLLADRMVELQMVEEISHETIRQVLKKTSLSPGNKPAGASRK